MMEGHRIDWKWKKEKKKGKKKEKQMKKNLPDFNSLHLYMGKKSRWFPYLKKKKKKERKEKKKKKKTKTQHWQLGTHRQLCWIFRTGIHLDQELSNLIVVGYHSGKVGCLLVFILSASHHTHLHMCISRTVSVHYLTSSPLSMFPSKSWGESPYWWDLHKYDLFSSSLQGSYNPSFAIWH